MKLSKTQKAILLAMAAKENQEASAYGLKINGINRALQSFYVLSREGLIAPVHGTGHTAFPETGTWRLTKAGKHFVAEMA